MSLKFNPITGQFDLVGNGSTAQSPNYEQTFVVADFSGPFSNHYQIIIAAATHGKGLNPIIQVFELVGSEYEVVTTAVSVNTTTGDVKVGVLATPDARFNGKVIISENN